MDSFGFTEADFPARSKTCHCSMSFSNASGKALTRPSLKCTKTLLVEQAPQGQRLTPSGEREEPLATSQN